MKTKNYIEEKEFNVNGDEVTAYKVDHDSNGNPRWVVHFLDLLTQEEKEEARKEADSRAQITFGTEVMMQKALAKARRASGLKYRAKWFGGGIVFQSYNLAEDLKHVMA